MALGVNCAQFDIEEPPSMPAGEFRYFVSSNGMYYLMILNGVLGVAQSPTFRFDSTVSSSAQTTMKCRLEWNPVITTSSTVRFMPTGVSRRRDLFRVLKTSSHTSNTIIVYTGGPSATIQLQGSVPLFANPSDSATTARVTFSTATTFFPIDDQGLPSSFL